MVPRPPDAVLPVLSAGGVWIAAVRGRARWAGVVPVALALALWVGATRPALLVSPDGALVGLMGPEGRVLSAPRGAGFAARSWLEDDGDRADQRTAAARPGMTGPPGDRRFVLGGLRVAHLTGRGAEARLAAACAEADLVILGARPDAPPPPGCRVIDRAILDRTGALAVDPKPGGDLAITAANRQARRWSGVPAPDGDD
jgi:competence protein ComEC